MKRLIRFTICLTVLFAIPVLSQEHSMTEIARGINFIKTKAYSGEDDARILKLYEGLRVANVSGGMDMAGLPGKGLVDPSIHPNWIDRKNLSHQIRGIAITVRYVPTQKPDRPA